MKALVHKNDKKSSKAEAVVELFEIAHQMKVAKFSDDFIASAVLTALDYEGVADLLKLWRNESDKKEKNEIIADIQDLVDDCRQKDNQVVQIKINDLEAIAKNIRSFKDALLVIANEKGGISHLAKLTGIPQPSLSRFFNSNAMPRRVTLLKIANALKLGSIKIPT